MHEIPCASAGSLVVGAARLQMLVHLGVQHTLGQRLLQLREQPILLKQLLGIGSLQQLI